MKLKYDSSEVDRSKAGDFEPPAVGVYPMRIESYQYLPEKEDKAAMFVFVIRMIGADKNGKGKGYGFWDRVSMGKTSAWRLDQYLIAAGIDTTKKAKGTFDPDVFNNLDIRARIKTGTYEGQYRPEIAAIFPAVGDVDLEDDEESEEDEVVAELEEAEDDIDIEDESEDEAEEEEEDAEEEEEEDDEAEEEEEEDEVDPLEGLDRAGLKAYNSENSLGVKVLKSMSDDDLKAAIQAAMSTAAPAKGAPQNYEDLTDAALKKELTDRGLSPKGVRSAMIARLRTNDDDPFAD